MQPALKASAPQSGQKAEGITQQAVDVTVSLFGYEINSLVIAMALTAIGILLLFWRIQSSKKLDFADMITKDGKAVSLTKVLQLVGGVTATWIMIKLTLTGGLTEAVLGIYLAYVGGIEGYSKFVAAKYNYKETSVKDHMSDYSDNDVRRPYNDFQRPSRFNNYEDVRYRGDPMKQKEEAETLEAQTLEADDPSLKPPKV